MAGLGDFIIVRLLSYLVYISFICKGWPFNSLKCTAQGRIYKFFLYIDQHPGINCILFIELFTNRHVSAIKKNNYSIFIPVVAIWLWGLRNNYLFYNLRQFLKFVLYWFPTKNIDRNWTIGQTGRIFFSAEDYTNMNYYNCCGIRPKHNNISKRVVRPKHSNISKGGYYILCGIEVKRVAMLCFISWLLICKVCSHPRRFSISITNQPCNVPDNKIKLIIFLFIPNYKRKSVLQKWLMVSKSWLNPWLHTLSYIPKVNN